ncbi:Uncharacterised protein [Corynebacterium diphtheriae]|nr:Uncharacterised protein [Corynebacterium diphtheriae]
MPENKPVHTTPQRESAPDFSTREVDNLYRNTPRIMETTGQVSHTGTSDYPHYRGYSQGNGQEAGSEPAAS